MEDKIVGYVYATTRDQFKYINGNRDIDQAHVKKLTKAALNGANFPPAIIDAETKVIKDGQHRYEVAKGFWANGIEYPFKYILDDSGSINSPEQIIEEIQKYQEGKKWATKDHIGSKIALGNPDYSVLVDFCAKHAYLMKNGKMLFSSGAAFLTGIVCTVSKNLPSIRPNAIIEADIFYDQLAQVGEKLGAIEHLFKSHVIVAWRRFSASTFQNNDQFMDYLTKINKKFIMPQGSNIQNWIHYFEKVLEK